MEVGGGVSEMGVQIALILLTIGIFVSLYHLPRKALSKLRSSNRTSLQSNRQFLQGAHLLSRARSLSGSSPARSRSLAKSALSHADLALSLNPRDPASHILRALSQDLLGHRASALRSLDAALSPPASKSLSPTERSDALLKRAELHLALNRRRRVDSALSDLLEALSLPRWDNHLNALCLLGQCYEHKRMVPQALQAFRDALAVDSSSAPAIQGLSNQLDIPDSAGVKGRSSMAIRYAGLQVYVAVGNNVQEGLAALEWAIKRWSSHPISMFILHADSAASKDLVNTPFGKLPVSAVNEDKLHDLRRCEAEKTDRMLAKYMAVCGVKAEILKIERHDEPIEKVMLELIMELHITKLVMAINFIRPSSGRSKSAISGSFYLHRNKPDFCDLFILCGGKLLFSREVNQQEEQTEDEESEMMAERLKQKPSLKGWLGKVLASGKTTPYPSSSSLPSPSSNNFEFSESKAQWTMNSQPQQIEDYFQQLLAEECDNNPVEENGSLCSKNPIQPETLCSAKMNEENVEVLKIQIMEAKRMTQLKKDEVKGELERQAKASWAISLCNHRAEELEARIKEEISSQIDLNKEMEDAKEQIYEAVADIQETKNRLRSLLEIQFELSNKLQVSSLAKSRAETQLENAASARTDLVRDIEELRKRRGILQRRIEFCKEKDAIGMAMSCKVDERAMIGCREFSSEEIKLATEDFSEHRRLKLREEWTNVFKGRINQNYVAIKMLNLDTELPREVFQAKVNLLMNIRHTNIVALIGYCLDLRCLVFEYMQNGCLRDILFSRRKSSTLQWHHRIHIAAEVSSAVGFLHLTQPKPITHGSLNPSNILLDNHLVSKLDTCQLTPNLAEQVDVHALGILLLQLLCGRNWAEVDREQPIFYAVDESAGEWPLDLVEEIMETAVKCMSVDSESEEDVGSVMSSAVKALSLAKKKADGIVDKSERRICERGGGQLLEQDETESSVPVIFMCPIFKGIMENPHIAADGYSYEFEAIEEWLQTGHDISPLTKMKLEHKHVTANHTLRSLIEEWRSVNPDLCS